MQGPGAQALIIPPNIFGLLVILGNAWWSDRRARRPEHILGGLAIISIGFVLLATVNNVGARYVGILLIGEKLSHRQLRTL